MNATPCRRAIVAACCVLAFTVAARAQTPTLDLLLARIVAEPDRQPYTLTADFTSRLALTVSTGKFTVTAAGSLVESRAANGEPRRRKVTVKTLDVPFLLRPFTNGIRGALSVLIEAENRAGEFLPTQDVFVADEAAGRYLLGGVRQDIVTEVMTKYGQTALLRDPATRRAIAKWLYAPSQRASITREGPPYMLSALVDETGLVHELTLFYDWGQVGSRLSFVTIGGRAFWREVASDTSTEVAGMGRVDGNVVVRFANHCLNCPTR